jgi:hypothetical protein
VTGEDSLRQRVEELSIELGGAAVTSARDGDATTWSVAGRPFASLTDDAVDLRLDPAIARAATRTPDTSPSDRGPDWVRFAPRELDDHAIDRLEAWFAFARRRASESARSS